MVGCVSLYGQKGSCCHCLRSVHIKSSSAGCHLLPPRFMLHFVWDRCRRQSGRLHLFALSSLQVLQQSGLPTAVPLQQAAPGDAADGDTAVDPVAGGSPEDDTDWQPLSQQSVRASLSLSPPSDVSAAARGHLSIMFRPCSHTMSCLPASALTAECIPQSSRPSLFVKLSGTFPLPNAILLRIWKPCAQASVPVGYVDAFLPADSHSSPFPAPVPRVRSAAVQLLISYMGATLGSLAAVRAFVQQAADGYRCVHARRSLGARSSWVAAVGVDSLIGVEKSYLQVPRLLAWPNESCGRRSPLRRFPIFGA